MSDFNPKDSFQLFHAEEAKKLILERESRWFTLALNAALAQMAFNGAESAEMKGARRLIDALLNLSDKPSEQRNYPVKELKTYDGQSAIQTEE